MRKVAPLPFLDQSVHSKNVFVMAVFYTDDLSEEEKLVAPCAVSAILMALITSGCGRSEEDTLLKIFFT